jgi:hypothetical protein
MFLAYVTNCTLGMARRGIPRQSRKRRENITRLFKLFKTHLSFGNGARAPLYLHGLEDM